MVTSKVIDSLYRTYKKRPSSPDELDIALLFDPSIEENHHISINPETLTIGSLPQQSPFHTLPLSNIHAIVEFDRVLAIVLHSSILFLNKKDSGVHLHLKMHKPGIFERLKSMVAG